MNVKRTIATLAAIASAAGASHALAAAPNPNASYSYRILNAPTSSDERAIRTLGLQPRAQTLSDKLFEALKVILGGEAPRLNFVPNGSLLTANGGMSTNNVDAPGAPKGEINVTPRAVEGLINPDSALHSFYVQGYTHEDAHTRQILQVLSDYAQAEGGAQAFADLVTPEAAFKAGISYKPTPAYDGSYAPYVQQAQQRGNDWLTGGQFGHAPVPWP